MITIKEIKYRLAFIRDRANLSGRELSGRLGMNTNYISAMENGIFMPPLEKILDILLICGATPEELFYEDFDNYKTDKELFDQFKLQSTKNKEAYIAMMKANLKLPDGKNE